jgi:hypothetical protein
MRIVNKKAFQAHPTPSRAYYAGDPFDREVMSAPKPADSGFNGDFSDDLDEQPRLFTCKLCSEVLTYEETTYHDCEE